MNSRFLRYASGGLFAAGLLLLLTAVWLYWEERSRADAWVLDRSEQVLDGVTPGQETSVAFRLKNTGRRPLRILGASAC